MNRRVLWIGLAVMVPLVVFLALGFRSDPTVIESPLIGRPAPEFQLVDLDGLPVSSSDFAGRPMLINFWATWCVPCIAEHETLRAAARRYADRVAFVGVIYQDDPAAIRQFLAQRGSWGRTLLDPQVSLAIAYGVYGVPESFLVGRDGRIAHKFTGAIDAATLERALAAVL